MVNTMKAFTANTHTFFCQSTRSHPYLNPGYLQHPVTVSLCPSAHSADPQGYRTPHDLVPRTRLAVLPCSGERYVRAMRVVLEKGWKLAVWRMVIQNGAKFPSLVVGQSDAGCRRLLAIVDLMKKCSITRFVVNSPSMIKSEKSVESSSNLSEYLCRRIGL
jgi:hypothetical protein